MAVGSAAIACYALWLWQWVRIFAGDKLLRDLLQTSSFINVCLTCAFQHSVAWRGQLMAITKRIKKAINHACRRSSIESATAGRASANQSSPKSCPNVAPGITIIPSLVYLQAIVSLHVPYADSRISAVLCHSRASSSNSASEQINPKISLNISVTLLPNLHYY